MGDYEIRTVPISDVIDLRTALLAPGTDPVEALTPQDQQASSLHVVATHEGKQIGVGSLVLQAIPAGERIGVWRISAIGVEHGFRGRGIGTQLLQQCLDHARGRAAAFVWCLVPIGATGFFERHGFVLTGALIEDPRGEHLLMRRDGEPVGRSWAP